MARTARSWPSTDWRMAALPPTRWRCRRVASGGTDAELANPAGRTAGRVRRHRAPDGRLWVVAVPVQLEYRHRLSDPARPADPGRSMDDPLGLRGQPADRCHPGCLRRAWTPVQTPSRSRAGRLLCLVLPRDAAPGT